MKKASWLRSNSTPMTVPVMHVTPYFTPIESFRCLSCPSVQKAYPDEQSLKQVSSSHSSLTPILMFPLSTTTSQQKHPVATFRSPAIVRNFPAGDEMFRTLTLSSSYWILQCEFSMSLRDWMDPCWEQQGCMQGVGYLSSCCIKFLRSQSFLLHEQILSQALQSKLQKAYLVYWPHNSKFWHLKSISYWYALKLGSSEASALCSRMDLTSLGFFLMAVLILFWFASLWICSLVFLLVGWSALFPHWMHSSCWLCQNWVRQCWQKWRPHLGQAMEGGLRLEKQIAHWI